MAETPLGITYPESGDHTRLWEHFEALATRVDNLMKVMGDLTIVYSNQQHILPRVSVAEALDPGLEVTFTNPLDVPVTIEVLFWGYMYMTENVGTIYFQVNEKEGTQPPGLVNLDGIRPERNVYPLSGATWYGSVYSARGYWQVPANATATFEARGRTTQGAEGACYVQYINGMCKILGPVAP